MSYLGDSFYGMCRCVGGWIGGDGWVGGWVGGWLIGIVGGWINFSHTVYYLIMHMLYRDNDISNNPIPWPHWPAVKSEVGKTNQYVAKLDHFHKHQ